ncbi:hypothetical protein [Saccharothrix coeruleofusca]|uniref:Uncharacterized protein n=1 Tax=Saccharothrix coeruleofusca TaxID=33919 RepID=A0A918ED45_9PSEU|nr:hypothetical protein [Saccharothrix coeruleofusca]GGP54001.1 hypothetical protein GCM10010185_27970 [Saccharothrix coeruleofusca]
MSAPMPDGTAADGVDPGGSSTGGSNLERRYRALLRVLPAWYRDGREEEMVEVFLADRVDELDHEHGWPGWGEAAATAALAVRVRLASGRPAGRVVRGVALAGLLGHVLLAAESVAFAVRFGPVRPSVFDLLLVVAFAALLAGRRGVARAAVGVVAVVAAALVVVSGPGAAGWWSLVTNTALVVTAAAVLLGFHREAPPVAAARWWWAAALGVVVSVVWAAVTPTLVYFSAWLVTAAVVAVFRPWRAPGCPRR